MLVKASQTKKLVLQVVEWMLSSPNSRSVTSVHQHSVAQMLTWVWMKKLWDLAANMADCKNSLNLEFRKLIINRVRVPLAIMWERMIAGMIYSWIAIKTTEWPLGAKSSSTHHLETTAWDRCFARCQSNIVGLIRIVGTDCITMQKGRNMTFLQRK